MLEIIEWYIFEKLVLKSFLPIFLTGIDFHSFLSLIPCLLPMGPQSNLLVDASVVEFIILEVADPFPFRAFHKVITSEIRI